MFDPIVSTRKTRALMSADLSAYISKEVQREYNKLCEFIDRPVADMGYIKRLSLPSDKRNDYKLILAIAINNVICQ